MEGKKIITTNEFSRLAYLKIGAGKTLVLLHGFPENGDLWRHVWPALSESYTVIIPDLPGAGDSTNDSADLSMEQMAGAVNEILVEENIDDAVLFGHSMGGYVAVAFAELYKEKVKGLSFVHSIATADSDEKKETRRKSIELIKKEQGKDIFIKQMIPALFSKAFKEEHPEILKEQIERGLNLKSESMISFYNAMINRRDRTKVLIEAAFPVQFIVGKEDTIASPELVMQQAKLANVNFVEVYTDCAHMSMLEQPMRLITDIEEFGKYCNR